MAKLSKDLGAGGNLHPRENLYTLGTLGAANAEVVVSSDGASSFSLDVRGTYVGTIAAEGTADGANWTLIPIRPVGQASLVFVAATTNTAGLWVGECAGFTQIRARMATYTSGAAVTTIVATTGNLPDQFKQAITPSLVTNTGAAGAAVTLTLPAPGAGLRQYLTYLSINRFATALLTAAATPVVVTTTNLPGTLAFSFPADAAAQGTLFPWREDFAFPLAASAQNTAVTVVCPATTGVIWRVTGGYYLAA